MFKKALILLILSFSGHLFLHSQYIDDARVKLDSDSLKDPNKKSLISKDNLVPGLEFMLTASNGVFYTELSPFIGIRPVKPFMAGVGVHGSFLAYQGGNNTYYGGHAFARLILADQFFLHAEYRLLNGLVPGATVQRQWVASPIFALGIMYGSGSYMMLGYAQNPEFQQINPFGSFVYRLGVYF